MSFELKHCMERLGAVKIAVIGLGISNVPLIRFLKKSGASDITAYDRYENAIVQKNIELLKAEGAIQDAVTGETYLEGIAGAGYDLIFRAPAIRPDLPEIAHAVQNGALLTSEMELFFTLCPCKIYGITGSDGKTTTTTLIYRLLSAHYQGTGTNVWLGGNIGRPLIDILPEIKPGDAAVLELSSFQLMTLDRSPDVAVITNITPNHLDIHKDYQEYIRAKMNIYLHQEESGVVVLNAQNEITGVIAEELLSRSKRVRLFSAHLPEAAFDARAEGRGFQQGRELVYLSSLYNYTVSRDLLKVPGTFNAENLLAAIAACAGEITQSDLEKTLAEFYGVEHRLEFVRELRGVKYYNSSIDSSPNRTIHTLSVFEGSVVLIAGGKDKNIPFDPVGPAICNSVKVLILIGPTAEKIERAVKAAKEYRPGAIRIFHFQTYPDAVKCAYDNSNPGDVVLLSPASTSFDLFRNFEERGCTFKALVDALE